MKKVTNMASALFATRILKSLMDYHHPIPNH